MQVHKFVLTKLIKTDCNIYFFAFSKTVRMWAYLQLCCITSSFKKSILNFVNSGAQLLSSLKQNIFPFLLKEFQMLNPLLLFFMFFVLVIPEMFFT